MCVLYLFYNQTLLFLSQTTSTLQQLEMDPRCKKCSLKDMLIRPVQRLPSVILLLKELHKCTDKANPDYQWLEMAISNVDQVLSESNTRRKRTDDFTSFIQTCNDIEGIPVSGLYRYFVKQLLDFADHVVPKTACDVKTGWLIEKRFCSLRSSPPAGFTTARWT